MVHRLVGGAGEKIVGFDRVNRGCVVLGLIYFLELALGFAGSVIGQARDEGCVLRNDLVGEFDPLEGDRVGGPEFEGINPFGPIGSNVIIVRNQ